MDQSFSAQLSQQLKAALEAAATGASSNNSFRIQKIQIENTSNIVASSLAKDIASKIKDLQEINRLLKGGNNKNKKIENSFTVCNDLISTGFEAAAEHLHEYVTLASGNRKADVIAAVIATKRTDLPEKSIVFLLNQVLNNFGELSFSSQDRSVNRHFSNQIIKKQTAQDSFALVAAILTASSTKNNLIKELRKNQITNVAALLEVILILLRYVPLVPSAEDALVPTFEMLCEWVEAVLDAYYLNFCLKEDWKDLLEKIDVEIVSKSNLYEQSKAFVDSFDAFKTSSENINKAINKNDSLLYVKSLHL